MTNQKDIIINAPDSISPYLQDTTITRNNIGLSKSEVFHVTSSARRLYLKVLEKTIHHSYRRETEILKWLMGKINVPEVVAYDENSTHEYLLLTEVSGRSGLDEMVYSRHESIVVAIATGLKIIHSIPIDDCPVDERLAEKLRKGKYNLDNGLVDEKDFDQERQGMTSEEVYRMLCKDKPLDEGLVFTHGDYCVPNIIFNGGSVSGFVDLDRAGVSDRFQDLSIGSRSIKYNMGTEYEQLFFDCYGISKPDMDKIEYYRMLDELF